MTDTSSLRWSTRPGIAEGERVVTVTAKCSARGVADYNMAFSKEELEQNSPYFFCVMRERMQETILEFIA